MWTAHSAAALSHPSPLPAGRPPLCFTPHTPHPTTPGFALVGGPARQDAPKAVEALTKLNVPYLVSLPLVFQTTEEWLDSELGVHPVQVALQVRRGWMDQCSRHAAAAAAAATVGCNPCWSVGLHHSGPHHRPTPHLPHCLTPHTQVALPELDGALEPIVFAGRDSNTGERAGVVCA